MSGRFIFRTPFGLAVPTGAPDERKQLQLQENARQDREREARRAELRKGIQHSDPAAVRQAAASMRRLADELAGRRGDPFKAGGAAMNLLIQAMQFGAFGSPDGALVRAKLIESPYIYTLADEIAKRDGHAGIEAVCEGRDSREWSERWWIETVATAIEEEATKLEKIHAQIAPATAEIQVGKGKRIMEDLLDRIAAAAPDPLVLTDDEFLKLDAYVGTYRVKVSLSTRGDPVQQARVSQDRARLEAWKSTLAYNRKLREAVPNAASNVPAQGKPSGADRSDVDNLPERVKVARDQYLQACEWLGNDSPTDRQAYDRFEAACTSTQKPSLLPTFGTWSSYLRQWRRTVGQQKSKSRGSRLADAGGSIVSAEDV